MIPRTSPRNTELGLGIFAIVITMAGYLLVSMAKQPDLPPDVTALLISIVGLFLVAHLAVRMFAPNATPTLLPIVMLLNGIGFVTIARLDRDLARVQSAWTAIGVMAFIVTLMVVKNVRVLERYKYSFLLLGLIAILLPLAPHVGREINGARLWVSIGPLNVQPGEAAKLLLVVFFAAYLVDKRELLAQGSRRFLGMTIPDPKHLGPLMLAWGLSIIVLVWQKDLGSSLLFFAIFTAMLYMATNRFLYLLLGIFLFMIGAVIAYHLFGHVQTRVSIWLNPWPQAQSKGYQIVQSLFAFGTGGFAGTGLGLGSPQKIPNAPTDFVFSAIGEELGLLGTVSIISAFILFIGSGFQVAMQATRPFTKLFAAGLTAILGIQTFVIVGGVTRLIPLTGVTLPFISFGGSSLIANYILVALLLIMSNENAETDSEQLARSKATA